MSIHGRIQQAVTVGRLVEFSLEFDSDVRARALYLHPELSNEIQAKGSAYDKRLGRLQADFELFVTGQYVAMSMTPYEHKAAFMGLLHPPSDGTWEIRSRDPKPGIRVFGKFPCADVFVALTWEPRSVPFRGKKPLGDRNSLEYQIALIEANQRWVETFPGLGPLIGESHLDYVSQNSGQV